MAHKGIVMFFPFLGAQAQVRQITIGKAKYNAPTDSYIDVLAKFGWYNDGGTIRRWARNCPDPNASNVATALSSLPSDGDPYFRLTLPTAIASGFDYSLSIVVIRQSTGSAVGWTVSGTELSFLSAGGQETYNVTLTLTLTKDQSFPAEFDDYQLPSNPVTGTTESYTDPRAVI